MNKIFRDLSDCSSLHPDVEDSDEMGVGLDVGHGVKMDMDGEEGVEVDEALVDTDVETIQALAAQGVDSELELSEAGRVRSDFVNDSRYKPY